MLERPRTESAARRQLEEAEHAIAVAIMVLRQHLPMFEAFADDDKRAHLLGPFDASTARVTAQVAGPSFEIARRFITEHEQHVTKIRAAMAIVNRGAA